MHQAFQSTKRPNLLILPNVGFQASNPQVIEFIPWGEDFKLAELKSSLRVEHLAENV